VASEPAITHIYTWGRTPKGIFQEMAVETGIRDRFGSFKGPGVLKTSLNLLRQRKKCFLVTMVSKFRVAVRAVTNKDQLFFFCSSSPLCCLNAVSDVET
jgi:hypothetical protein